MATLTFSGPDLARLRRAAGLTRTELAAAVGASENTVGRWERSETEPSATHTMRILHALECNPEDLTNNTVR